MALRVLLADESTTIKKVMQLALQDFAVDVKSVQAGIDALEVARAFKPEIVFADVLLQKRNGYEVCSDLKNDPQLKDVPVVLMWSSFMDLDEKAFVEARADGKLEKPFDVEALRSLVTQLVHRAGESKIASFLRFPPSLAEPLEKEEAAKRAQLTPPVQRETPSEVPSAAPAWNMNSFSDLSEFATESEDQEAFSQVRLVSVPNSSQATQAVPPPLSLPSKSLDESEPWAHQNLARFKVEPPESDASDEEISVFELEADPTALATAFDLESSPNAGSAHTSQFTIDMPSPADLAAQGDLSAHDGVKAPNDLEAMIRLQSLEIIEAAVRRIVPEIASRLIKEELERLLKEHGETDR